MVPLYTEMPPKITRTEPFYKPGFKKVLREIDPEMKLSSELVHSLDEALKTLLKAISFKASHNASMAGRRTIMLKDIEASCLEQLKDFPDLLGEMHLYGTSAIVKLRNSTQHNKSRASQSGISLSVAKTEAALRTFASPGQRVSEEAAVYLAGVLQKALIVLFAKSSAVALSRKRKIILTEHAARVLIDDEGLGKLLSLGSAPRVTSK
jgi:histone H3/H4